jgi:2-oxoglutarate ferredoxin oxidoreductase subunit gamma
MRWEMRICGSGGQGAISAANLLAMCAVSEGFYAAQTQTYGPASRGGASKAEVVISDGHIDYPYLKSPDLIVAMSQEAYDRYTGDVGEMTRVIIDPDLVEGEGFRVSATSIARDFGSNQAANMVMLGAITPLLGFMSVKPLRRAVERRFPGNEINLRCFDAGVEIGRGLNEELKKTL